MNGDDRHSAAGWAAADPTQPFRPPAGGNQADVTRTFGAGATSGAGAPGPVPPGDRLGDAGAPGYGWPGHGGSQSYGGGSQGQGGSGSQGYGGYGNGSQGYGGYGNGSQGYGRGEPQGSLFGPVAGGYGAQANGGGAPAGAGRSEFTSPGFGATDSPSSRVGTPQYGSPGGGRPDSGLGANGTGGGGPSRKVVAVTLSAAVVAAVVTGIIYGTNRSGDDGQTVATTVQSSTMTPTQATRPVTPSASVPTVTVTATSSASPSATATVSTPAPGPAPKTYVEQPWATPGMDFGQLVAVKKQGAGAVLTVKRQQFLTGDQAREYYAAHPDVDPLDYAIVPVGGKARQFTLAPGAVIYGQYLLGDHTSVTTTTLTMDQFLDRAKRATGENLQVWLYHRIGPNGPVVYLAEQFIP